MNFKYSEDFQRLGYEANKTVHENGEAKYEYAIVSAGDDQFMAQAKAIVDFDKDGIFNVWQIDESGKLNETVQD